MSSVVCGDLTRDVERAIYAAAFVAHFEENRARGITARVRQEAAETGADIIKCFEDWCIDAAIESAANIVEMHREGWKRYVQHYRSSAQRTPSR